MTLWNKLKAFNRERKNKNRKAIEAADNKIWWNSFCKVISPNRIEVFDTNLIIDQRTWARCLIVGLPTKNGEGYPRDMTSKAIERIQDLSFDGCKVMMSHSLIQIPNEQARDDMQKTLFTVNVNQEHEKQVNPGSTPNLTLMCKGEDVVANYREMYFNGHRSFHSSLILVITGVEKEVFNAESKIISILKSEIIDFSIPAGKQLEMFLAAMPFPISDSKSWVEVRSDTAAILCTSTNLNSRTDEKGLYFGKDLKTNAEILIDLDTLPAKHLTFLGATGAGKTFSFLMLLMRMHDMQGSRIVYTTPKADSGTDYRAVADYYGQDACIVDIGPSGSNINPLQILFDKQAMGTSPLAYAKAYDMHKGLFIRFCKVWLNSVSDNMESYLDETLNMVYEQAGIIRDQPDTWTNTFPVFRNLRDIWEKDSVNKDLGTKAKTAEALFNKTYHAGEKGTLNYMNKPTTDLDLSKDFIIIDLSGVPDLIQDAMNVMVTGMIGSRFSTDSDKETIIAVDEAAVYLRSPELAASMLKTLTQGRSHKVFLWLATHQPSDFKKNQVKEEYKTNMFINIVLGNNLENSIDDVKDYFNLTDEEAELLSGADVGEGLLIVKGQRIPIRFEPTDLEMSVIKGTYGKENLPNNLPSANGYSIFPDVQWLVDEHHIILKDWVQGDADLLKKQGYDKQRVQRIDSPGPTMAYVPSGMVVNGMISLPHFGKQSLDHYASVVQLTELLVRLGYEDVIINHGNESTNQAGEVDIEAKYQGKTFAFEYENYNNKSPEIFMRKLESALGKYDVVQFVCSDKDSKFIGKAIGDEKCIKYILKRGEDVMNFVSNPFNEIVIDE